MRTCLSIIFTLLYISAVSAQTDISGKTVVKDDKNEIATQHYANDERSSVLMSDSTSFSPDYVMPNRNYLAGSEPTDSLHLPALNSRGQVMTSLMRPLYWGGWYDWNLHEGLNINIGASVFAQFGKGAHGGAGFTQNISAMYAVPLSKKLSVAIGGYFNNMFWGRNNYRDGGVSAVLGYKFNDKWEGYVYGQKSLMNKNLMPMPLYDINAIGDRIGAAVKYNVNPTMSIQISVENSWSPVPGVRPFGMSPVDSFIP